MCQRDKNVETGLNTFPWIGFLPALATNPRAPRMSQDVSGFPGTLFLSSPDTPKVTPKGIAGLGILDNTITDHLTSRCASPWAFGRGCRVCGNRGARGQGRRVAGSALRPIGPQLDGRASGDRSPRGEGRTALAEAASSPGAGSCPD